MYQLMLRGVLLLLFALGGCWAMPPPTPAQQSEYSLDQVFPDPKAQQLALAAEQGNVQEVRRLMKDEGVDPDKIFGAEGMPLLAWPVFTRNPEGLKAMLENGADPNVAKPYPHEEGRSDTNHANAMVWAAEQEDPIYLKLLLDHGGDPNTRNANRESLLFHALIKQNQRQNVKLLVERGAEVNSRAGMGSTITEQYASFAGFEMIYWLLRHGADPSVTYYQEKPVQRPDSTVIATIFWYPSKLPDPVWQRRCQQWLVQRGFKRPPLPKYLYDLRKEVGFPVEENDVPLILPPTTKD
jgi:hypothetical protein